MQQDKKQEKKQVKKQNTKQGKVQSKKQPMPPSDLEKRKRRFLVFFGFIFVLGFLYSSVYVIRLVHSNSIPANFQFIISAIKVLDIFLLVSSPIYAALIFYSYIKGMVASKKAFYFRFIFAAVLFLYSLVIFFGLR